MSAMNHSKTTGPVAPSTRARDMAPCTGPLPLLVALHGDVYRDAQKPDPEREAEILLSTQLSSTKFMEEVRLGDC